MSMSKSENGQDSKELSPAAEGERSSGNITGNLSDVCLQGRGPYWPQNMSTWPYISAAYRPLPRVHSGQADTPQGHIAACESLAGPDHSLPDISSEYPQTTVNSPNRASVQVNASQAACQPEGQRPATRFRKVQTRLAQNSHQPASSGDASDATGKVRNESPGDTIGSLTSSESSSAAPKSCEGSEETAQPNKEKEAQVFDLPQCYLATLSCGRRGYSLDRSCTHSASWHCGYTRRNITFTFGNYRRRKLLQNEGVSGIFSNESCSYLRKNYSDFKTVSALLDKSKEEKSSEHLSLNLTGNRSPSFVNKLIDLVMRLMPQQRVENPLSYEKTSSQIHFNNSLEEGVFSLLSPNLEDIFYGKGVSQNVMTDGCACQVPNQEARLQENQESKSEDTLSEVKEERDDVEDDSEVRETFEENERGKEGKVKARRSKMETETSKSRKRAASKEKTGNNGPVQQPTRPGATAVKRKKRGVKVTDIGAQKEDIEQQSSQQMEPIKLVQQVGDKEHLRQKEKDIEQQKEVAEKHGGQREQTEDDVQQEGGITLHQGSFEVRKSPRTKQQYFFTDNGRESRNNSKDEETIERADFSVQKQKQERTRESEKCRNREEETSPGIKQQSILNNNAQNESDKNDSKQEEKEKKNEELFIKKETETKKNEEKGKRKEEENIKQGDMQYLYTWKETDMNKVMEETLDRMGRNQHKHNKQETHDSSEQTSSRGRNLPEEDDETAHKELTQKKVKSKARAAHEEIRLTRVIPFCEGKDTKLETKQKRLRTSSLVEKTRQEKKRIRSFLRASGEGFSLDKHRSEAMQKGRGHIARKSLFMAFQTGDNRKGLDKDNKDVCTIPITYSSGSESSASLNLEDVRQNFSEEGRDSRVTKGQRNAIDFSERLSRMDIKLVENNKKELTGTRNIENRETDAIENETTNKEESKIMPKLNIRLEAVQETEEIVSIGKESVRVRSSSRRDESGHSAKDMRKIRSETDGSGPEYDVRSARHENGDVSRVPEEVTKGSQVQGVAMETHLLQVESDTEAWLGSYNERDSDERISSTEIKQTSEKKIDKTGKKKLDRESVIVYQCLAKEKDVATERKIENTGPQQAMKIKRKSEKVLNTEAGREGEGASMMVKEERSFQDKLEKEEIPEKYLSEHEHVAQQRPRRPSGTETNHEQTLQVSDAESEFSVCENCGNYKQRNREKVRKVNACPGPKLDTSGGEDGARQGSETGKLDYEREHTGKDSTTYLPGSLETLQAASETKAGEAVFMTTPTMNVDDGDVENVSPRQVGSKFEEGRAEDPGQKEADIGAQGDSMDYSESEGCGRYVGKKPSQIGREEVEEENHTDEIYEKGEGCGSDSLEEPDAQKGDFEGGQIGSSFLPLSQDFKRVESESYHNQAFVQKEITQELQNVPSKFIVPERQSFYEPPEVKPVYLSLKTLKRIETFLGLKIPAWLLNTEKSPSDETSFVLEPEGQVQYVEQPSPVEDTSLTEIVGKSDESADVTLKSEILNQESQPPMVVENDRELNFACPLVPMNTYSSFRCKCSSCIRNPDNINNIRRRRSRKTLLCPQPKFVCGHAFHRRLLSQHQQQDVWANSELATFPSICSIGRLNDSFFLNNKITLRTVLAQCKACQEWNLKNVENKTHEEKSVEGGDGALGTEQVKNSEEERSRSEQPPNLSDKRTGSALENVSMYPYNFSSSDDPKFTILPEALGKMSEHSYCSVATDAASDRSKKSLIVASENPNKRLPNVGQERQLMEAFLQAKSQPEKHVQRAPARLPCSNQYYSPQYLCGNYITNQFCGRCHTYHFGYHPGQHSWYSEPPYINLYGGYSDSKLRQIRCYCNITAASQYATAALSWRPGFASQHSAHRNVQSYSPVTPCLGRGAFAERLYNDLSLHRASIPSYYTSPYSNTCNSSTSYRLRSEVPQDLPSRQYLSGMSHFYTHCSTSHYDIVPSYSSSRHSISFTPSAHW